jgi:chromosome segregation and condensation protein ScpB
LIATVIDDLDRTLPLDGAPDADEAALAVELALFCAPKPLTRAELAVIAGESASVDEVVKRVNRALSARPYHVVFVAGGYRLQTRPEHSALVAWLKKAEPQENISQADALALTAIAYFQPITRRQLENFLVKPPSRDTMAKLVRLGHIATGPRSPEPGAPPTYVTTQKFLSTFGFGSLDDLPAVGVLREEGLLHDDADMGEIARALGVEQEDPPDEDEPDNGPDEPFDLATPD